MNTTTTTRRVVWRLKEQPTPENIQKLVEAGLLTKDEGREILLYHVIDENTDVKVIDIENLKSEIKFLKELVQRLSNGQTDLVIEIMRYIKKPYYQWNWYKPYEVWCASNVNQVNTGSAGTTSFSSIGTELTNGTN